MFVVGRSLTCVVSTDPFPLTSLPTFEFIQSNTQGVLYNSIVHNAYMTIFVPLMSVVLPLVHPYIVKIMHLGCYVYGVV